MGVLDKFLDMLKLSDEDEEYDEDFLDDEEEYEEISESPKRNFFKKDKNFEDDNEDDDYNYPLENEKRVKNTRPSSSKVTPMRQPARKSNMEVCVIKPSTMDDSREITETLLSGRTVILNLEGMDYEIAQRIVDFTSGATFAINGNLQKISNYIFLLTPTDVDISGDLQDLLNSSFDVPSIKTRY